MLGRKRPIGSQDQSAYTEYGTTYDSDAISKYELVGGSRQAAHHDIQE